ncbi:MAG TPA: YoaK family protein [Myxococcaceae bacterium]|nr:YoaK family protein [Myxococcaceae bacterium]
MAPDRRPPSTWTGERILLPLLSLVAGMVDVTGFLTLGHVFTAHITGNLALLAASVVEGAALPTGQLLSIPAFAGGLAIAYLLVRGVDAAHGGSRLLEGQALLLFGALGLMLSSQGTAQRALLPATILTVAAMALQNVFVRVSLRASLSTSVMTTNIVVSVIALVALLCTGPWSREEARQRLKPTLPVVGGFLSGCLLGGVGVSRFGPGAWAVPALLSLVTVFVGRRAPPSV